MEEGQPQGIIRFRADLLPPAPLIVQGRIQRLGTTCPCCRLTEQAVYLTVESVQAARPNLCEFCGEMYVGRTKVRCHF